MGGMLAHSPSGRELARGAASGNLWPVRARGYALLSVALLGGVAAPARSAPLGGDWESPAGALTLSQHENSVQGRLISASGGCPRAANGVVFKADLLDDSLSGELQICCGAQPAWVPVLLLVAPEGKSMSGAASPPKGCGFGGAHGAIAFRVKSTTATPTATPNGTSADLGAPFDGAQDRLRQAQGNRGSLPTPTPTATATSTPTATSSATPHGTAVRQRAIALAREGEGLRRDGRFEQARQKFLKAVQEDPSYAEGFNGVGVTYYARNDYGEAMRWYKKALQADPDFGDAYYNLGCIYALEGNKAMSLRYLRAALRNGYVARQQMARDGDLRSLAGDPDFEALVQRRPAASAHPQP
jgi:TPR repeat